MVTKMSNDLNKLTEDLRHTLKKYGFESRIYIQEFKSRESFYDKNNTIFDTLENEGSTLIKVDKKKWLLSDRELRNDFLIPEVDFIEALVLSYFEEIFGNKVDLVTYPTLKDLEDKLGINLAIIEEMIYNEIDDMDFKALEDYLESLFGISCSEEYFDEIETLAYWTTYFKPCYENEDIAWKVGLFPFRFDGDFYLALGGCGMDLSPKLDAYQALTDNTIPSFSQFIRQPDYAKYVVGSKVFEEVMKAIKRDPIIEIHAKKEEN